MAAAAAWVGGWVGGTHFGMRDTRARAAALSRRKRIHPQPTAIGDSHWGAGGGVVSRTGAQEATQVGRLRQKVSICSRWAAANFTGSPPTPERAAN